MRKAALILVLVALTVGFVAGLFGRLDGFGSRPLAVDEYYFVRSIEFILESGLPEFPTGGYYIVSPVTQFLTAVSASLLGATEATYRLPSLLFSLGSIALAFAYVRRFAAAPVALAVALAMALSSWNIEFARFARMYAGFQFVTLLFLIVYYDSYFRSDDQPGYYPHLLAVVATLTHELGALLGPLLFIPLLDTRSKVRFPTLGSRCRFGLAGLGVIIVGYLLRLARFRNLGVSDRFPGGFIPDGSGGMFRVPDFPFWSVGASDTANLAVMGLALIATAVVFMLWKKVNPKFTAADVIASLAVVAAAAHAFVVLAALLGALVVRFRLLNRGCQPRRIHVLAGLSVLIASSWLGYALTHTAQLGYAPGGPSVRELIRRAFFGWPDFYIPLWVPWAKTLPFLSVLILASLAYQFVRMLRAPGVDAFRNPAFVPIYIAFCFAVLRSQYTETRYTYSVYPVLLLVVAVSVVDWTSLLAKTTRRPRWAGSGVLGATVFVGLFMFSHDFNPSHIAQVATDEVGFRIGRYERFQSLWYPRTDYRSAAEFVSRHAGSEAASRIVVVGEPPVSYYLDRDHAIFYSRNDNRFQNVCRQRGTVDLWSDRRLLSTPQELRDYASGTRAAWFVLPTEPGHRPLEPGSVWDSLPATFTSEYSTVDGRLEVMKAVPNGEAQ